MAERDCLCWVGHGDCGGCSGVPGIAHEPACGWEQNPDCPEHGLPLIPYIPPLPEDHVFSPEMLLRLSPEADKALQALMLTGEVTYCVTTNPDGGPNDVVVVTPP